MAIESTSPASAVTSKKLWFGLATAALAWLSLGVLDTVIVWRTCENFGRGTGIGGHESGRSLSFSLALLLLILTLTAGITSYRNWRALSKARTLVEANATDRREFMALLGVFVSLTMGFGILWLLIAPIFITACQRAK